MLYTPKGRTARRSADPSFVEFVTLVALIMAIGAFSIDNIMPAFGPIHAELKVESNNQVQLLMSVYMIAFAVMQLVYGPVSDMIGRRPTLIIGMSIYIVGSVCAVFAPTFDLLLVARALQGLGAACTRVVSVALVRDRYEGREMARVMSLTMVIFILVPMLAPAIGSLILHLVGWRAIFAAMLALAIVLMVWFSLRMPETLKPQFRQPASLSALGKAVRRTVTTRATFGYSTCMAVMFGCIMSYINSAQQIFETEVYNLAQWFPLMFAAIAGVMGVAAFVNSRLVMRLGMRRLAHGATIGFTLAAGTLAIVALWYGGRPPLLAFSILLALCHFLFSIIMPNSNAMAMEPLGDIAGTASSVIGFYTTLVGAVLGLVVGQAFDGTVIPIAVGYFLFGFASILLMLWTEEGRLFRPHHAAPPSTH
ncbi:MAG: MFS transporter [Rhizobiales bacterium 65-9]|nr:multidrug effflux MFS transporter [Hyphomicrobiales bacterium]OJY32927.1 MAG: MFS transporter [Rhizobiales bacterium 65-9]